MLYYITILIIFLVLGFAGIILFKKITYFQIRINGEIKHTQEDGIGIKFKIKSQVQELVLKSFVGMIQSG